MRTTNIVLFSQEALTACTAEQKESILRLMDGHHSMTVMAGGFDLPDGYLQIDLQYRDGSHLYGGIAPDGRVST